MNKQIIDYQKARFSFIKLIDRFPKTKREELLFDEWSLKDMLVHLIGWAEHQIEIIRYIKQAKTVPDDVGGLKNSINTNLVAKRRGEGWSKVYKTFLNIGDELEKEYSGLTPELWKKEIWTGKGYTPCSYFQIEINHYQKTHGPQIQKVLKKLHS